ncbi:MAG: hypothetical protein IJF74_03310 [Clostridia bacterium]|nr:hypothetical protein [Clostridia bacterium]
MDYGFKVSGILLDGNVHQLNYAVEDMGEVVKLTVPKRYLDGKLYNTVEIESALTTAHKGDDGYMFFPTTFGSAFCLCRFDEKPDTETLTWLSAMTVGGICENDNAVFIRIEGMRDTARFRVAVKDGVYCIHPRVELEGDDPDEDITVYYYKMPGATYSDMAKVYRKYQMDVMGCMTLKEKAKRREAVRKAAESMEIRVRMGWKPIPTPIRQQTLANEPEMYVAATISDLHKVIDKMQEVGVDKAEFCLVGWGPSGHDGRFPQQYPCDDRIGGDDELVQFIARAQRLGYQVVCHTVTCGAYEIANNFCRDDLCTRKDENGDHKPFLRDIYKKNGLNGGDPWALCPQLAYEKYAKTDLPVVRGYGFAGLHYVDELTAYIPEKCSNPKHPVSRKKAHEYYRKIAQLSRQLFGGYQSEGYMDFMNADVDSILYTGVRSKWQTKKFCALHDEGIPFWQLVYHGLVLSNATSQTINYTLKGRENQLIFIEYGGRPVMYFNSKFGPDRNWMGDVDLYNKTDEQIADSVAALKRAYDEFEPLKHLQYEFMDNHEKLGEKLYRTTYSDGTMITVDYKAGTYTVEAPGKEPYTVQK